MNHIEALRGITGKVSLWRSLRRFYATHPPATEHHYSICDSMALSFVYEVGGDESEFPVFLQRYREFAQGLFRRDQVPAKHCANNVWIVKPANLNQGRGIVVARSLVEVRAAVENRPVHSQWVIQKYIERPMLYKDRKFDIRLWVLVTDRADVFLYRGGYIRTSSNVYSLDSSENYVHLTNNCLQQFGSNYGKFEDGNTLGLEVLREYIAERYGKSVDFDGAVLGRMRDLILDTVLSVKTELMVSTKKRGCAFELLGYDFMVDEDLRVWLIEVNTNPYLGIPNAYIRVLLPKMLDDLFDLVLDRQYPRDGVEERKGANDFELLYCEKGSLYSDESVNRHRGYGKDLLYPCKELLLKQQQQQQSQRTLPAIRARPETSLSSMKYTIHGGSRKARPTHVSPDKIPPSRPPAVKGLEETAKDIMREQNYSGLQPLFSRLLRAVKDSCGPHDSSLEKEIVSVFVFCWTESSRP